MKDPIRQEILLQLRKSKEPLETKEVLQKVRRSLRNATRTKVLYRLNILRGDQQTKGKQVGPGKKVWIWWKD